MQTMKRNWEKRSLAISMNDMHNHNDIEDIEKGIPIYKQGNGGGESITYTKNQMRNEGHTQDESSRLTHMDPQHKKNMKNLI